MVCYGWYNTDGVLRMVPYATDGRHTICGSKCLRLMQNDYQWNHNFDELEYMLRTKDDFSS